MATSTLPQRGPNGQFLKSGNPTTTSRPRKNKNKLQTTFVTLVLDSSSSMRPLRSATVKAINDRLQALRNEGLRHNQQINVTLLTFADQVNAPIFKNFPINIVKDIQEWAYFPDGNTALLDAVGYSIEEFKKLKVSENDAFLIEVFTDGEENKSRKYGNGSHFTSNRVSLPQLLHDCYSQGNWTVAFQVPKGHKAHLIRDYKIPAECVHEWEATVVGTESATHMSTNAYGTYFTARSLGEKRVQAFYQNVNLADVSKQDLKSLDDLSSRFKVYVVDKNTNVKAFTESKTHKPYVIGQTYYELVKEELVQHNKDVCIMERGKTTIFGGREARILIGLPDNVNTKVNPVNLSKYHVFVKSSSVNRKIYPGSRVLIDTNLQIPSTPTW